MTTRIPYKLVGTPTISDTLLTDLKASYEEAQRNEDKASTTEDASFYYGQVDAFLTIAGLLGLKVVDPV